MTSLITNNDVRSGMYALCSGYWDDKKNTFIRYSENRQK